MFKPYVFLRGLLLLAGDVETNPGPIQGRWRDTHIDSSIGGGGVHVNGPLYVVSGISTLIKLGSIAFWHAHLS